MTYGQLRPLGGADPRQLGRFAVLGVLGEGGMGRVFLGRSPGGWAVAIKVIHAGLAADPGAGLTATPSLISAEEP